MVAETGLEPASLARGTRFTVALLHIWILRLKDFRLRQVDGFAPSTETLHAARSLGVYLG